VEKTASISNTFGEFGHCAEAPPGRWLAAGAGQAVFSPCYAPPPRPLCCWALLRVHARILCKGRFDPALREMRN